VLPEGFQARTGDATAARASNRIDEALSFVTTFLLVFAGVALTVGAFLIVNTFSILVAQRSRELALLRAIGASRRQVARSVLLEAGVVGLVGSAIGLGLGFVLAVGIKLLFGGSGSTSAPTNSCCIRAPSWSRSSSGSSSPSRRPTFPPGGPAVPPVAAMRDDVALAEGGLRWRIVVGCCCSPRDRRDGRRSRRCRERAHLRARRGHVRRARRHRAAQPGARPPGARRARLGLPARVRGRRPDGRAERPPQPPRTGATASALMIGVALVTMMAVLGASAKASLDQTLAEDIVADFVVSNAVGRPSRRRSPTTWPRCRVWPRSPACVARCSSSTATATSPPVSNPAV
jgi:putative ABC transport system permease protein